jgi:hypothetical protein
MTEKGSAPSTTITSMAEQLNKLSGRHTAFTYGIVEQENSKVSRLQELAMRIGLPVYETQEFTLPSQGKSYLSACEAIIEQDWRLALRLTSDAGRKVLVRQLDADFEDARVVLERVQDLHNIKAQVMPYRTPGQSGTILINRTKAVMEFVFGPHFWISKTPPEDEVIYSCSFDFPYLSLRYSTDDPRIRAKLYSTFQAVLEYTTGLSVMVLRESMPPLYAEFHWHKNKGYRFIEYSNSHHWTS